MPIYSFKCPTCCATKEWIKSKPVVPRNVKCGCGSTMEHVKYPGASFQLKGQGWERDGYS